MLEKKLQKQIYEFLLKNSNLNCHLIHGASEHGIDILIRYKDVFDEYRYIGISVKVGDIKCNKTPNSSSLATIIHQLIIAGNFKFPQYDQYLDAVYLITDGTIAPEAMSQINSVRLPYRNIYFLEGTHMNKLFKSLKMSDSKFGGETVTNAR